MPKPNLPLEYRSVPQGDVGRQPDARKTLVRAIAVLCMLAISVFGMLYVGWYILKMK